LKVLKKYIKKNEFRNNITAEDIYVDYNLFFDKLKSYNIDVTKVNTNDMIYKDINGNPLEFGKSYSIYNENLIVTPIWVNTNNNIILVNIKPSSIHFSYSDIQPNEYKTKFSNKEDLPKPI